MNGHGKNRITISDVATALGISKTTVSRAISGKGRIGESTRQRVLEYIQANDYHPNPLAKGLAQDKTYNIGWVMPGDSTITDLPFFQRCMIGISEVATTMDYDIMICMLYGNNLEHVKRMVRNHKVDGVVVGRTMIDDECVRYLRSQDIPFVVIGSSNEEGVIQVDNDHIMACCELTNILIMKGIKRIALIGGDSTHMVNQTRRRGFEKAIKEQGIEAENVSVFMDAESKSSIERYVEEAMNNKVDCIIGMDDRICFEILAKFRKDKVKIPQDIKLASFYSSVLLESNVPAVTSLQYDPKELGRVACKTLFDMLEGKDVESKVLLDYAVALRGSTQ